MEKKKLTSEQAKKFGAIGGSKRTYWKRLASRRNARRPKFSMRKPKKPPEPKREDRRGRPRFTDDQRDDRFWWHNDKYAVRAWTIGLASKLVYAVDRTIRRGTIRREWKRGKPNQNLPSVNGVYRL